MRLAITGSRGFIGHGVGSFALAEGHDVLGFSRSSQPAQSWTGSHQQADVSTSDLAGPLGDFRPDVVVHAAGPASVRGSFEDPGEDLKASVSTWGNLLDSVRRSGLSPLIVFVSSAAVYGEPSSLPVGEQAPTAPLSPYGWHKLAAEGVGRGYSRCFGLPVVVCRLFSVFGAGQRRLLIWDIYAQLAERATSEIVLRGTGEETRDFLHISDVGRAVLALGSCHGEGKQLPEVVNVASGRGSSVREVAEVMTGIHGSSKAVRFRGEESRGEPGRWVAGIGLLRGLVPGWSPLALEEGLKLCMDEWRE